MNKHSLRIILLLALVNIAYMATASGRIDNESLIARLDSAIANRDTYITQKENEIRELKHRIDTTSNFRERFDLLGGLFSEYHSFKTDSAYAICERRISLANQTGDREMLVAALLNMANIHTAVGMYAETVALLDSIDYSTLPDYLRSYYFHTARTVYGNMAAYSTFKPEKALYESITDAYRDSLLKAYDPGSMLYALIKADQLNVHNKPREAISLMENFMAENELSEHDRAICAWTLSESYGLLGDKPNQKQQMLISAISDMKSAVREYVSLRQLAIMLYQEGDLDRAYKYLTIAVDDAAKCNARQRIIELNDTYPTINSIYVETVRNQKKTLERTIIIITLMAALLIFLLIFLLKQMRRLRESRRNVEAANTKLNEVNNQLTDSNTKLNELNVQLTRSNRMLNDSNAQLNELNVRLTQSNAELQQAYSEIAEISELKEVYISKYMEQSLAYIEMLDGYRKSIAKLVNSGKTDDLKKFVKSTDIVDNELKLFYDRFDQTFLNLFPTFVDDFNNLLLPEEAIIPKKPGTLNTELRIFALIRLGITDSDKIAQFLRYSLTTIYNYRTKVRNKARGDRNLLESEITKIGHR